MVKIVFIGYALFFHKKFPLRYTQDVKAVFYNEDRYKPKSD
jgi:hypothetical protein